MSLAVRFVYLAVAALASAGCTAVSPQTTPPAPAAGGDRAESVQERTGTTAKPVFAKPVPGAPVRVRIPSLGVNAPVLPIKAPGGTLVPPADPQRLGWWADGARPGDRSGSVLVTGHTVSSGPGALNDLETLRRGDRVTVGTRHGKVVYTVASVRVLGKGRLAKRAEALFDQSVASRLVVVTCEDWDGTRYLSNVVVTAVPAD